MLGSVIFLQRVGLLHYLVDARADWSLSRLPTPDQSI
jgi:hypothetical protein